MSPSITVPSVTKPRNPFEGRGEELQRWEWQDGGYELIEGDFSWEGKLAIEKGFFLSLLCWG